jgi:DNA-binding transcriptional regulator YiaG
MTITERRAALDRLGLSQRGLARMLGVDEGDVRRWFRTENAPEVVDAFLGRMEISVLRVRRLLGTTAD